MDNLNQIGDFGSRAAAVEATVNPINTRVTHVTAFDIEVLQNPMQGVQGWVLMKYVSALERAVADDNPTFLQQLLNSLVDMHQRAIQASLAAGSSGAAQDLVSQQAGVTLPPWTATLMLFDSSSVKSAPTGPADVSDVTRLRLPLCPSQAGGIARLLTLPQLAAAVGAVACWPILVGAGFGRNEYVAFPEPGSVPATALSALPPDSNPSAIIGANTAGLTAYISKQDAGWKGKYAAALFSPMYLSACMAAGDDAGAAAGVYSRNGRPAVLAVRSDDGSGRRIPMLEAILLTVPAPPQTPPDKTAEGATPLFATSLLPAPLPEDVNCWVVPPQLLTGPGTPAYAEREKRVAAEGEARRKAFAAEKDDKRKSELGTIPITVRVPVPQMRPLLHTALSHGSLPIVRKLLAWDHGGPGGQANASQASFVGAAADAAFNPAAAPSSPFTYSTTTTRGCTLVPDGYVLAGTAVDVVTVYEPALHPLHVALRAPVNVLQLVSALRQALEAVPGGGGGLPAALSAAARCNVPQLGIKEGDTPAGMMEAAGHSAEPGTVCCAFALALSNHADAIPAVEASGLPLCPSCTPYDLRAAGYTALGLKRGGLPAIALRVAGYSLPDLLSAGCSLSDLHKAGYWVDEVLEASGGRYTAAQLRAAGYTAVELHWSKAHFSVGDLRSAGYSAAEVKAVVGMSAQVAAAAAVKGVPMAREQGTGAVAEATGIEEEPLGDAPASLGTPTAAPESGNTRPVLLRQLSDQPHGAVRQQYTTPAATAPPIKEEEEGPAGPEAADAKPLVSLSADADARAAAAARTIDAPAPAPAPGSGGALDRLGALASTVTSYAGGVQLNTVATTGALLGLGALAVVLAPVSAAGALGAVVTGAYGAAAAGIALAADAAVVAGGGLAGAAAVAAPMAVAAAGQLAAGGGAAVVGVAQIAVEVAKALAAHETPEERMAATMVQYVGQAAAGHAFGKAGAIAACAVLPAPIGVPVGLWLGKKAFDVGGNVIVGKAAGDMAVGAVKAVPALWEVAKLGGRAGVAMGL